MNKLQMNTNTELPGQSLVPYICFVEDSKTAAIQVKRWLEASGQRVDHFFDAESAFEALQSNAYDVLLTDLSLKDGMSGLDLVCKLRELSDPLLGNLPALVLTGDDNAETLYEVFEAGANDHMIKPIRAPELIARLNGQVAAKRRMDQLAADSDTPVVEGHVDVVEENEPPALIEDEIPAISNVVTALPLPAVRTAPAPLQLDVDHQIVDEEVLNEAEQYETFPVLACQLANTIGSFRWWVIAATFLLVLIAGLGLTQFKFTDDYKVYFGPENPQLHAFETLEKTYSENYNVYIAVEPKSGDVFQPAVLMAITDLTDRAWSELPFSSRVDSLTNFQHTRSEGDDLLVSDLVENPERLHEPDLKRIREIALKEPHLVNNLVSSNGEVSGVNIAVLLPERTVEHTRKLAVAAQDLVAEFKVKYPGINFYLSGSVMLDYTFSEAATRDISILMPAMIAMVLLVAGFSLRSVSGSLSTGIMVIATTLVAMGIAAWSGVVFSTLSVMAPTIILTLAVADSVHVLVNYYQALAEGKEKSAAIHQSLRMNLKPIFLTSLTTAIGFLSMNFSDAPPFHDLGNVVAIGVLAAFFLSITLLPALMYVLPTGKIRRQNLTNEQFHKFADWVINKRAILLPSMVAVVCILSVGMFKMEFGDRFVDYFDEGFSFRTDSDFISDNITGMDSIQYSLNTGTKDGIYDPEYLNDLDRFASWWRQQDGVAYVLSVTDIVKRLNFNMHGNDEFFYRLPETRQQVAQYLLLYEISLPRGLELTNQVNLDKSASLMKINVNDRSTERLMELEVAGNEWLQDNAPHLLAQAASPSLMFAHISKRNIFSMLSGTVWALILISLALIFALNSTKLGLISLLPNLIPATMAFGLWGLVVGEIGLAVSVVAAMTLGIVVDDTVHFLSKYEHARDKLGMHATDAVRYVFQAVGPALVSTSLILIAGFLILAMSGFAVNSDMGLLTAVTIVFALATDFLLLPTLLIKFDRAKSRSAANTDTGEEHA